MNPPVTWTVQKLDGPEGSKVRIVLGKMGDTINFVLEPEQAYEMATAMGAAAKDAMTALTVVTSPAKLLTVP